jgi:hypothetical protein
MQLNELLRQRQALETTQERELAALRALVAQGRGAGGAHPERDDRRWWDGLGAEVEGPPQPTRRGTTRFRAGLEGLMGLATILVARMKQRRP